MLPEIYSRCRCARNSTTLSHIQKGNVTWFTQYLKSSKYPKEVQTCILAHWVGRDGQIIDAAAGDLSSCGRIEYFFSQRLLLTNGQYTETRMACVKWFQQHDLRHVLMKPAQLWHEIPLRHSVLHHLFQWRKYWKSVSL